MRRIALVAVPVVMVSLVVLVSGCRTTTGGHGDGGSDRDGTASQDGVAAHDAAPLPQTHKLDVLFMIDNSNSMQPKQDSLSQYFPRFMQPLEALGTKPDLHIGIVTSDLGAGPYTPPTCARVGGDRGVLQNTPKGTTCGASQLNIATERFLRWAIVSGVEQRNFSGDIADAFACYAAVGVSGCAFEQQLASVQAALDGCATTQGCTQTANKGFLRSDAYLAVILLTDEDDCSAPPNSSLFNTADSTVASHLGPLTSYRCFEFGDLCNGADPGRAAGPRQNCVPGNKSSNPAEQLTPVEDFASFLKSLKPNSRQVYLSAITGPSAPVQVGTDSNGFPDLQPSCTGMLGTADPGIRLTKLVGLFDSDRASFINICANDLSAAMDKIAVDLASML
jgi:hypothetical protein